MAKKSKQEELVGAHPPKAEFFGQWLRHTDLPASKKKKHRKLEDNAVERRKLIEKIKEWLITHHLDPNRVKSFEKRKGILNKRGYKNYIRTEAKALPVMDTTQKGNCAEIILAEYLIACSKLNLLAYRLHYNPNVDQSMKGDDVLLLNKNDVRSKIILGEAKFRSTASKKAVEDILENFNDKRLPLSLPFLAQHCRNSGDLALADEIEELNSEMHRDKIEIVNVGFLMANEKAADFIDSHGDSENESLVLISLGLNNPEKIVEEAFEEAFKHLEKI